MMEVSVIGSSSQVRPSKVQLGFLENGVYNFGSRNYLGGQRSSLIRFCQSFRRTSSSVRLKCEASSTIRSQAVVPSRVADERKSKRADGVKLFVGLPLDAVSDSNTIDHARAIAVGLKALKLLGVDGVELPVWWGVAEKVAMGQYDWSGYLALVEIVKKLGLELHVSLCFHASKEPKIPLPQWVSQIGESEPSIYFTDRSGKQYKDCLSLGADDLPVLEGRTPIQVYKEFCEGFKKAFSQFLGSTITSMSISLGPDAELRYPSSHNSSSNGKNNLGVGEFQCFDKNMLCHLKQRAEELQNPLWGLSGPHDSPSYNQLPTMSNFFKDNGGSWETPYGDFFLSWYSTQLLSHGDRVLSLAASTFSNTGVAISGKIPLLHSWYRTNSHPSEVMAGFYNTVHRDGYEEFVEVFAKNSCKMILPGMELSDEQTQESHSSPELLLAQITAACKKHGVEIFGQNSSDCSTPNNFVQIKKNLVGKNAVVSLFAYQRMGAYFFSPEHFPSFSEFVRSLKQPQLHSDDQPLLDLELAAESSQEGKNLSMQTA